MLNGLPVLIVEDEPRLAMDLQTAIEQLDGLTIGPVASAADALALLKAQGVAAAIVDTILLDGAVSPLALKLIEQSVPFVLHTALGLPVDLAAQYPHIPVVMKPARPAAVLAALLERLAADRRRIVA